MTTFRVRHRTTYSYDRPVAFGVHRLMVRPRGGHDMRILESSLAVSPAAQVRWTYDTFGNCVALLSFQDRAAELVVASELTVRRYGVDDPLAWLARHGGRYPFAYDPDEATDLAPMLALGHEADRPALEVWLEPLRRDLPGQTVDLLQRLARHVHESIAYNRREERGVQSPAETLALGTGTCRDYALLFIEAARLFGFAARFVSGYLHDASADPDEALSGGGATHAWADVFVPGVGWTEFDPTNRIIASRNLLRVATTRTPDQALPLSGTFRGRGARPLGMSVDVQVRRTDM